MILSLSQKVFLAGLAYERNPDTITSQLCNMFNIDLIDIEYIYVEKTDTEMVVFRVDDTLVILSAGTESFMDFKNDVFFIPSSYIGGYLHKGFKRAIYATNGRICKASDFLFDDQYIKKIIAIGHSLGAVISMGACDSLYYFGYQEVPMEITTFGCPNGWSSGALDSFNSRHTDVTNYVNHGDYVTWLLGLTTGRPGHDIKLDGKWGHFMAKYQENVLIQNKRIV